MSDTSDDLAWIPTTPRSPSSTTPPGSSTTTLPTDLSLHSKLNTIQAELGAVITVINQLAASVAQLQAGQTTPTPTTTTSTTPTNTTPTNTTPGTPTNTTAPLPCPLPQHPCTIASGRGAASPEVFQEMIKINWHGRLGRTHMADVDGLPVTALTELDCLLRRRLHAIFPRGGAFSTPDPDTIFASLAALGLRLENRGAYADLLWVYDTTLHDVATVDRGKNTAVSCYAHNKEFGQYWCGSVVETLIELARYRGLFDDEGFLKE